MPFFAWASLPSALHEKRLCLHLGQCLLDKGWKQGPWRWAVLLPLWKKKKKKS